MVARVLDTATIGRFARRAIRSQLLHLISARGSRRRSGEERSGGAACTLNSSCQEVTIYTVSELAVLRAK